MSQTNAIKNFLWETTQIDADRSRMKMLDSGPIIVGFHCIIKFDE